MRIEFSVVATDGVQRDFIGDADPATPLAEVLEQIDFATGEGSAFVGPTRLDPSTELSAGPSLAGAVVTSEPTAANLPTADGPLLLVVSGADAGRFHPLTVGSEHTIGRSISTALLVDDPTTARVHASIQVDADGRAKVRDLNSSSGTIVRGQRISVGAAVDIEPGEQFILGQAVLEVMAHRPPRGSTSTMEDGTQGFNRVQRLRPAPPMRVRIDTPAQPSRGARQSTTTQLISSGVMVLTGIITAIAFGNILFAVVGVLAPVAMFSTTFANGRAARREAAKGQKQYERDASRARAEMERAVTAERDRVRGATLDPARAALAALTPTTSLWSVAADDPEGMVVRVGTRDRSASIEVSNGQAITLVAAPVSVDLRQHPVIGIAGPAEYSAGVTRAIVHQLVLSHGADELAVVHLSEAAGPDWAWLRWLPHTRSLLPDAHTVSPSPRALKERLAELNSLLKARKDLLTSGYQRPTLLLPQVLIVLENGRSLRRNSAVVTLMNEARDAGIFVVAVDLDAAALPREATATMVVTASAHGAYLATLDVHGADKLDRITPDLVTAECAARSARAIAGLTPLGGSADSGLPDSVRLSDILGLNLGDPHAVARAWSSGSPGTCVLGVDETGNPDVVDLPKHGPHALVVGATGSGKSELVRTMLAGLALSSPPTDLSLLLIDYKGGGAFGKLRQLPHVVGYADNLSIGGVLAQRLLDSLRAELKHRQSLFQQAGNSDKLEQYQATRAIRPDLPPVTRLVIAVDEFAQLKQEQPTFIDGLVEVARIGRSLGVHLILATQQPSGIVTEQIRSNLPLRICLRTLDTATSRNVVDSPVAGGFAASAVGRAAVLSDTHVRLVQTGYISAPARDASDRERPAPRLHSLPWDQCGIRPAEPESAEGKAAGPTDLTRFVDAACVAAEGMTLPDAPWLPPLPAVLTMSRVQQLPEPDSRLSVSFGIEDRPAQQSQVRAIFTLGTTNLGVAGGTGSGRSTALTVIAAALAEAFTADEVHLHVLDYTATAPLARLRALPHCGTFANRRQTHTTARLVARLREELERRALLLAQHGLSTFAELVARDGLTLPWLVLFVDGWDTINTSVDPSDTTRPGLLRLAEDGPSLGLQMVIAGGSGLTSARLLPSLPEILCLRFSESSDMTSFGVPKAGLPKEIPPGQARRPKTGNVVQVALVGEALESNRVDAVAAFEAHSAAFAALAASAHSATTYVPFRVEELPTKISIADARERISETGGIIVGVGGDAAQALTVDFALLRTTFGVFGRAGTGRTTALAVIANQLDEQGVSLAVYIGEGCDTAPYAGLRVGTLRNPPDVKGVKVIVVDDTEALVDSDPFMLDALGVAGLQLIVAADPSDIARGIGWRPRLGATSGILLAPARATDAATLGARPDAIGVPSTMPPGRGYLIRPRTSAVLIQVPQLDAR